MFSLNSTFMIAGIISWIKYLPDFFSEAFRVLIQTLMMLLYVIFLGICQIIELCESVAKQLAGLGGGGDMALNVVLTNGAIWTAFKNMLALGSLLLFVATFVAVFRSYFLDAQRNSVKIVIANFVRSLINLAFVPALCFVGIYFGNRVLIAVDAATSTGGGSTTQVLFKAAAHDANNARDESSWLYTRYLSGGNGANTFNGAFSASNPQAIDDAFVNEKVLSGEMELSIVHTALLGNPMGNVTGEDAEDKDNWVYKKYSGGSVQFTMYNCSLVAVYYNLLKFNYVIGIGAGIILLKTYIDFIFGLIKRLYAIGALFIIAPPIIGIYPLDDGASMGRWKAAFVGSTLSAYGAVVAINVFLILVPIFTSITFFSGSSAAVKADEVAYVAAGEYAVASENIVLKILGADLANSICQTFMLIGGAMFLKEISREIASIIGAKDAIGEGAAVSGAIQGRVNHAAHSVAHKAAHLAGGVAGKAVSAAAKGASAAKAKVKAHNDVKNAKKERDEKIQKVQDKDKAEKEKQEELTKKFQANASKDPEAQANAARYARMIALGEVPKKEDKEDEKEEKSSGRDSGSEVDTSNAEMKSSSSSKVQPASDEVTKAIAKKYGVDERHAQEIQDIEKEFQQKKSDIKAYDPVKNPIKASIRGMKSRMSAKYNDILTRGMSDEDKNTVAANAQEIKARRQAIAAQQRDMKDDIAVAKRMGDKAGVETAKGNLDRYMHAVHHGLERNNAYWTREAERQKTIQQTQNKLNEISNQLRIAQKTGGETQKLQKQMTEMQQTLHKIERMRTDPEGKNQ